MCPFKKWDWTHALILHLVVLSQVCYQQATTANLPPWFPTCSSWGVLVSRLTLLKTVFEIKTHCCGSFYSLKEKAWNPYHNKGERNSESDKGVGATTTPDDCSPQLPRSISECLEEKKALQHSEVLVGYFCKIKEDEGEDETPRKRPCEAAVRWINNSHVFCQSSRKSEWTESAALVNITGDKLHVRGNVFVFESKSSNHCVANTQRSNQE